MQLRLARQWWMGALVALTGIVLLALNASAFPADGDWPVAALSTASAAFVTVLGFALTVQRERNV